AGVVTVVVVASTVVRYSTWTMSFDEALAVVQQPDASESTRLSGLSTIATDSIRAIEVTRGIAQAATGPAKAAQTILDDWLAALSGQPTSTSALRHESPDVLWARAADIGQDDASRADALNQLSAAVHQAI